MELLYNIKVEALRLVGILNSKGYDSYLIGSYPFIKYHNSIHQDEKMKVKNFSIITNATLPELQKLFTIKESKKSDFNKYVLIEDLLKSNLIYFKVYYATSYFDVVNQKEIAINTVNDILNQFNFLIDTIRIDKNANIVDFSNKKSSAFESVESKALLINGNLREKLMINPLIMLDLCYRYSNIDYTINDSLLKIISNNYKYLKHNSFEDIVKYFNMILTSKNPSKGLKIIKLAISKLDYNGIELFKFLTDISDEYLERMDKFDDSVDIISRWAYLLKEFDLQNYLQIIDNFKLSYKNKIVWLIQHFDIIKEENYKMAIFNSKESLKDISEEKWDIFLLFQMFNKLTIINRILNPEYEQNCKNIIECIYCRPFFEYQLKYDDNELSKIANVEKGPWLDITKKDLLLKILFCDKHPDEQQYLELVKESIEYGLISSI